MYVSLRSDQAPRVSFQKGFVGTSGVTDSKSFLRPRKLRASRVTQARPVAGCPQPLT